MIVIFDYVCLKVLMSSATYGVIYEELVLDNGNAILPDTTLSTNEEHLYVLTQANVSYYIFYLKFLFNYTIYFFFYRY